MSTSMAWLTLGFAAALAVQATAAAGAPAEGAKDADEGARAIIDDYHKRVRPLEIEVNLAWWKANATGSDDDFAAKEEAQNKLDEALADRKQFAELKAVREAKPGDALVARQIEVLYLTYLEKQVPAGLLRSMSAKSNAIEKAFNVYRAQVGDKQMTDSQVKKVLTESKDSAERQEVWEASKAVGPQVEADLRALVLLRNEAARQLGFKDYHALQLSLNEQSQEEVLRLFDELDQLTREPFLQAKAEIDAKLAEHYGVKVEDLRPWHYHDPFFQEAPAVFGADLDKVFEKADILKLNREFYAGIDLPIDDVLQRSDLYERRGKSPHAFCTDIDREGDVRVLANIVPNERWMGTMLHELGHSVYSSKNMPREVPYELRTASHILTTEGVAMMFERFSKSGDWLVEMGVDVPNVRAYNEAGARMRRNELLIFSRWVQVMLRFEVGLYGDPGQDLNKLWWDLVEKYQGLKRPEGRNAPDYASKIHVVSAPAYYHNYMLGQLFACQVHRTIAREILHADDIANAYYTKNAAVGKYMRDKVFAPGRKLPWNELTKFATGEDLNAEAFAAELGGSKSAN